MSDKKIECEKCETEMTKDGIWTIYPKILKDCYPVVHCDKQNRILGIAYMVKEELLIEFPVVDENQLHDLA